MGVTVDVAYKSLNKFTEILCGDRVEILKTADSDIMILADGMGSGVKANILGADTRNIDGRAFGTMLLGLPGEGAEKALAYIAAQKDITVEEVPDYHV